MKSEQIETYAQTAYERYGDAVGWLAGSGHPMPRWDALRLRIRAAWREAARGALGLPPRVRPGALAPRSIGEIMDAAAAEGDTSEDCEP